MRAQLIARLLISLSILSSCSTILVANGPYLLIGPADAPISELKLPNRDICEATMPAFFGRYNLVKCNAQSANLPFTGIVRFDYEIQIQELPISGRSLQACQDLLNDFVKKARGTRIVSACK